MAHIERKMWPCETFPPGLIPEPGDAPGMRAQMDKTVKGHGTAVAGITDGMTVMIGGFGGAGSPIELIHALIDRFHATGTPKDLTVVNNNAGNGHVGLAALIEAGMVTKLICSHPRSANPVAFTTACMAGRFALELVPRGTLAERIRAGGGEDPRLFHRGLLWHRSGRRQAGRGL